jgi:hypothetical protein
MHPAAPRGTPIDLTGHHPPLLALHAIKPHSMRVGEKIQDNQPNE